MTGMQKKHGISDEFGMHDNKVLYRNYHSFLKVLYDLNRFLLIITVLIFKAQKVKYYHFPKERYSMIVDETGIYKDVIK